jgi:hypothetical protein
VTGTTDRHCQRRGKVTVGFNEEQFQKTWYEGMNEDQSPSTKKPGPKRVKTRYIRYETKFFASIGSSGEVTAFTELPTKPVSTWQPLRFLLADDLERERRSWQGS